MINIDKLLFRLATLEDAQLIFDLSNDVFVRKNSINKEIIKWEDHLQWLNRKLQDENYVIYLIFYGDNFVGQTKFEIQNDEAIVSISIHSAFRGMKIAPTILRIACAKLWESFKKINTVIAYIKSENIPSIRSFQNAGFYKVDHETIINQEQFLTFIKKMIQYDNSRAF